MKRAEQSDATPVNRACTAFFDGGRGMGGAMAWSSDNERELQQRVKFEYECQQARARNKKRHKIGDLRKRWPELANIGKRIPNLDRSLWLRPSEVATLKLTGSVTFERQIWPPSLMKLGWCQYGTPGSIKAVREPIAYFGVDPENAVYAYSEDVMYREGSPGDRWVKLDAKDMPDNAIRFWVSVISTERIDNKQKWRIAVNRVLGG